MTRARPLMRLALVIPLCGVLIAGLVTAAWFVAGRPRPAAGATWKQLFGAANCTVRVPPSGGPYTRIEISPDQTTWTKIGEYLPPSDNEFSSYWAYGRSGDGATLGGTTYYTATATDPNCNTSEFSAGVS